jgi:hypothetical protein
VNTLPGWAILAVLCLAASGGADAQDALRYSVKEGEAFAYSVKSDLEIKTPGTSMKVRSEILVGFVCESAAAPFELRAEILREKLSVELNVPLAGKLKGAIDTGAEKPPVPENPLDLGKAVPYGLFVKARAKTGRAFHVVVDERGRIVRLREVQALLDRVKEALHSDPAVSPIMVASLERDLTPEFFRQTLDGIFVPLPEGPVRKGDAWSRDFDQPMQDGSVLKLTEKVTLGDAADGSAAFVSEVRLVKPGQEITPSPDVPLMKIRSATADAYRLDVEGVLNLATGRPAYAVSLLDYASTQEVENTLEGKVRKSQSTIKGEVTVETAEWPKGR